MHNYLSTWRRVRRYAVSQAMIAECTQLRLAGDWAGAVRAARIDAEIDLVRLSVESGRAVAERIEQDLLALAPDLLRWNLPRDSGGTGALATGQIGILSRQPAVRDTQPLLVVHTPWTPAAPQRLRLEVTSISQLPRTHVHRVIDLPDFMWLADRVGLARQAYGASNIRLPRFRPDGTPLPLEDFARAADPADPATAAEAIHLHHAQGRYTEALRLAGIELDDAAAKRVNANRREALGSAGTSMVYLAGEIRRLAQRHGDRHFRWGALALSAGRDGGVTGRLHRSGDELSRVETMWLPPPSDLDLVWHGLIEPGELHPAVGGVLFPGSRATLPRPDEGVAFTVRCQGVWHRLEITPDGVVGPHDAAEMKRERLLAALGGQVSGCAAVSAAWRSGSGWLPKALRAQRSSLFLHVLHGDTDAVLRLLDDGFDPLMRDGLGRCLLHHLAMVDSERLLPRLLAAGLDVNAQDMHRRTPLHDAVRHRDLPLARALVAAGADGTIRDVHDVPALPTEASVWVRTGTAPRRVPW